MGGALSHFLFGSWDPVLSILVVFLVLPALNRAVTAWIDEGDPDGDGDVWVEGGHRWDDLKDAYLDDQYRKDRDGRDGHASRSGEEGRE